MSLRQLPCLIGGAFMGYGVMLYSIEAIQAGAALALFCLIRNSGEWFE